MARYEIIERMKTNCCNKFCKEAMKMSDEDYDKYAEKNCGDKCPVNRIIRYYEKEIMGNLRSIRIIGSALEDMTKRMDKEMNDERLKERYLEG